MSVVDFPQILEKVLRRMLWFHDCMSLLQLPTDRRWRRLLIAVLLVGLFGRLVAGCVLQSLLDHHWHRAFLIEGDADGYWRLAGSIVAGQDYAVYTPPRYVLRMPGFPVVLAGVMAIAGPSLLAARIALAFVGTLAVWLVYSLGRQLVNEKTGVIAAGLAAVSPVLIVFSELILSETLFAVTLLLSLIAGTHLFRRLHETQSRMRNVVCAAIGTGIAIAAGVYVRPSWILAAPILAVVFVGICQRRWPACLAGGVLLTTMLLALLPWGIRNWQVTGHWTLTTFWMGPSLYDGLNSRATGDSDMTFFDRDALMTRMSEYEVDQHYRAAAWDFVRRNPARVLELAGIKAVRYWNPWPNADQFRIWPIQFAVGAFNLLMFAFAVVGLVEIVAPQPTESLSARQGRPAIWSILVLAGPILYFAVLHMVFVSSLRYRLPAEYPLLVLTAMGMQRATRWWRRTS